MDSRRPHACAGELSAKRTLPREKTRATHRTGRAQVQLLAEREGFEPPIPLRVCRISSAVHSTALPPLHASEISLKSLIWTAAI